MKPVDISASFSIDFYAQLPDAEHGLVSGPAHLYLSPLPDEVYLAQQGHSLRARIANRKIHRQLNQHLGRGGANLVFIKLTRHPDRVQGMAHFFFGDVLELGDLDIVLDDDSVEAARKTGLNDVPQRLAKLLTALCTLETEKSWFMIVPQETTTADAPVMERGFYLQAPGLKILVAAQRTAEGQVWRAKRFVLDPGVRDGQAIRLASGHLHFTDQTNAALVRSHAAQAIEKLLQDGSGYLRMWDRYGDEEGRQLLEHAREVGALRLNPGGEAVGGGSRFYFAEQGDKPALVAGDRVQLVDELPEYLANPDLSWEQYRADVSSRFAQDRNTRSADTKAVPDQRPALKVLAVDVHGITLEDTPAQQSGKCVVLSLGGDETQIVRREKARQKVLQGTGGMPYLGMIIEENGRPPRCAQVEEFEALTPFVRDKVFRQPPTCVQEQAIRIALNTPDIVVIQGPPGTGKTTVISAIIERLNEEQDRSDATRGSILVSGFQHDAVENIVARLSINALPAVKFGRRSGQDNDASAEIRRNWSAAVIDHVRGQAPKVRQSEQLLALRQSGQGYMLEPSKHAARALLLQITLLPADVLDGALVARASVLLADLQEQAGAQETLELTRRLRLVYALRVSEAGFRDDGPSRAAGVLQAFEDDIDDDEASLLERAQGWQAPDTLDFLSELQFFKAQLLDRLAPAPVFRVEKARSDILELLAEVQRQVHKAERRFEDPAMTVMAEFLHELEWNPTAVDDALADYSYVYAATCQGAMGADIIKTKGKNAGGGELDNVYSTVIIDEAARCSPRDLLIPMVLAQRRIILVGDQRQLPHIIDEQLVRKLDQGMAVGEPKGAGDYRRSLFDYLFARLKELEAQDGISRTITLDAQYRMHPLLGEFVSEHYYERHNAVEKFRSPRPAHEFHHGLLSGSERPTAPLAWLDVPVRQGREKPDGSSSLFRDSEAVAIARQLKAWIDSPAGQKLSFGVISFYKAQVRALHTVMGELGLSQQGPGGEWGVAEEYRYLHRDNASKREERLRVGTVDAFQGMEFDVVFLSMVRTPNTRPTKPGASQEERHAAAFGRLVLENLRCVALSRQKCLLVVVGDSTLLEGPLASTGLPDLVALRALCSSEGVEL